MTVIESMDETMKNIVGRGGLEILYGALQEHKDFWANWIGMRTGPTADFFAPTEDEQAAAKALGDALKELQKGFELLEKLQADED
jgi:hypothetical protein